MGTMSISLLVKLSLFGLLWSQVITMALFINKVIPNYNISAWIAFTLVFVIIHHIDVIHHKLKNRIQ